MELWEDISKKVGDAANAVGRGAEKLTDIAKLKYNITVRQGKLEKVFESIGRMRYDEFKNGVDNADVIADLIADADAISAEIADLRERLDERIGAQRCKSCGAKMARGASFCSECGAKQESEEEAE